MFKSSIIAGFECGLVHGGTHDLLHSTMHTPEQRMRDHYRIAKAYGCHTARDGLVPGHDNAKRLQVACEEGMQVIWDLSHYHRHDDPVSYAEDLARWSQIINGNETLWVCPVNEPELVPHMRSDMSRDDAIQIGLRMLHVLKANHPNVRVLSVDAVTGIGGPWEGTDAFSCHADVIGVNLYPHTVRGRISDVLIEAHRRYGKPVVISETSWHCGFHDGQGWRNKAHWLADVQTEIGIAISHGVNMVGLCWYPFIDSPPWDDPQADVRWSHGLIKGDVSIDSELSAALMATRQPCADHHSCETANRHQLTGNVRQDRHQAGARCTLCLL